MKDNEKLKEYYGLLEKHGFSKNKNEFILNIN